MAQVTPATATKSISAAAQSLEVPLTTKLISSVRLAFTSVTTQNPLIWSWWKGSQNPLADMEGPYYLIGAPDRQYEEGKVILANASELIREYLLAAAA